MSDAIKIGSDLTPEENLRAWAKVLVIDSGRFVNEDLEHAADQLSAQNTQIAALREALRSAWVIEDKRLGVCAVITDKDGVPFRVGITNITAPYWQAWDKKRRAALEMSGGVL